MGYMRELEAVEWLGREEGLRFHIETNFFPPFPGYVKDNILEGFQSYWAGEIDIEGLRDKCYLRDTEGLYRYFSCFL